MRRSGAGCERVGSRRCCSCARAVAAAGRRQAPDVHARIGDERRKHLHADARRFEDGRRRGEGRAHHGVLAARDQRARDPRQNHDNFGSTYWPSPQSSWCAAGGGCWPPPAAIDSGAYTGGIDAREFDPARQRRTVDRRHRRLGGHGDEAVLAGARERRHRCHVHADQRLADRQRLAGPLAGEPRGDGRARRSSGRGAAP